MTNEFANRLNAVDQTILTPAVRDLLSDQAAEVIDWHYYPISGGMAQEMGHSFGLYRFQGTAQSRDRTFPWSLILKATGGPSEFGTDIPSHWAYWKREVLAYQSGLLDNLPGNLVAPRCFGVFEYPGDECWIWLEDIRQETESAWPLSRYGLAARHLGQFNGAYLDGRPLPNESWLSRGRVHDWLDWSEPTIRELRQLRQHPLVRRWFGNNGVERLLSLWSDRNLLLAAIGRLPHCLCHHDAFRRNLMARTRDDGRQQTVAIDWAIVGTGVIGEEIASMVAVSLQFFEVDCNHARALDTVVFDGYLTGLRDVGWRGDVRLVRLGYAATASLFMGVAGAGVWLAHMIQDNGQLEIIEKVLDHPLDAVLDQFALLQAYLLDLGDEARELAGLLG